jgi:hypothetical protein
MKHRANVTNVLRIVATVLLSILLAYASEAWIDHYTMTVDTPGEYIAHRVVSVPPPPNQLATLGESILVAFAVDSACYFALISGLFFMVGKLRDKPETSG